MLGRQALHTAEAAGQRRIQCLVLLLLGDVHRELELHSEATAIYTQARTLAQTLENAPLTIDATVALAETALAGGDSGAAMPHVAEVACYLHDPTRGGFEDPARVYLSCYRVLVAAGDLRAYDVLDAGAALVHERAAQFDDKQQQWAYGEDIPSHREILRHWRGEMAIEIGGATNALISPSPQLVPLRITHRAGSKRAP